MSAAGAETFLTELDVDQGLSWDAAIAFRDSHVAEVEAAGEEVGPHGRLLGGPRQPRRHECARAGMATFA